MIKDGKLKFKESNGPTGMEDPSKANREAVRQEQKSPREANPGKAAMPNDKVPTDKVRRSKAFCSSATEGSKEQLCEPNGKEEKKAL